MSLRRSQNGAYGNSVIAGYSIHQDFNVKYRNSLLRAYASENPGGIGGIITLIADMDAREKRLNDRISHLEWLVSESSKTEPNIDIVRAAQGVNTLLRIPRSIWRRLFVVRRLIARVRGRV